MARASYDNGRMTELFEGYGATVSWDDLCAEFDVLSPLADCEHESLHHQEGDVATHTRMVLAALMDDPEYRALADDKRFVLFWTCVFHDVGKPARKKTEDGVTSFRGHSRTGAMIARGEMMAAGMPYADREHLCSLITAHQIPFFLYEHEEAHQTKTAVRLSLELDTHLLILHARADARGRICEDPEDVRLRVELSKDVFEQLDIYGARWKFANDESKVAYFRRDDRRPDYKAWENPICTVTVMSALPGTGKDTWIAENHPELPVVSLDDLREEMNLDATDNQGTVRQAALEAARQHLRQKRDFVWNATNVTFDMRAAIIGLLRDYDARIRIVYLETSPENLIKQNGERRAAVPVDAIQKLARKLDPPKDWEAHEVVRVIHGPGRKRKLAPKASITPV